MVVSGDWTFHMLNRTNLRGLAEAFLIKPEFIDNQLDNLLLGDNIFFGHSLPAQLREAAKLEAGNLIVAHPVCDPQRYGVVEFTQNGVVLSVEEKPQTPRSHYALVGIFF